MAGSLEFPFLNMVSKPDTHRADYQLELILGQKLEQPGDTDGLPSRISLVTQRGPIPWKAEKCQPQRTSI